MSRTSTLATAVFATPSALPAPMRRLRRTALRELCLIASAPIAAEAPWPLRQYLRLRSFLAVPPGPLSPLDILAHDFSVAFEGESARQIVEAHRSQPGDAGPAPCHARPPTPRRLGQGPLGVAPAAPQRPAPAAPRHARHRHGLNNAGLDPRSCASAGSRMDPIRRRVRVARPPGDALVPACWQPPGSRSPSSA